MWEQRQKAVLVLRTEHPVKPPAQGQKDGCGAGLYYTLTQTKSSLCMSHVNPEGGALPLHHTAQGET